MCFRSSLGASILPHMDVPGSSTSTARKLAGCSCAPWNTGLFVRVRPTRSKLADPIEEAEIDRARRTLGTVKADLYENPIATAPRFRAATLSVRIRGNTDKHRRY